jgi:pimeloyl-ACP methyl ester carboxylesterase
MVEEITKYNDPQPEKSNRRTWLKRTGVGVGGALILGDIALNTPPVQRSLIYKTNTDFSGNNLPPINAPADYGLKGIVAEEWATNLGDKFLVWHSESLVPNKKTLVLFPGNAGHLGASPTFGAGNELLGGNGNSYIEILKEAIDQGYQVVAAHPVGYGNSKVAPTQQKMFEGAEAVIDEINRRNIEPKDIHITGISMGTTLAAHAANHLASTQDFVSNNQQQIYLNLVNGLISLRAGLEEFAPAANALVMHVWDNLDTSRELEDLAAKTQKRGNVTFLRGGDDPVTPKDQIEAHRRAARGMNFRSEEVPNTRHYVTPKDILRQFDEMTQHKFESPVESFVSNKSGQSIQYM